jgi:sugar phosphate isomerase/epimerase
MKRPIGIQMYTVRDAAAKSFPETLKRIAKIGYYGVEFAGFGSHSAAEIVKMLNDTGLKAMSMFCGVPDDSNIAQIMDDAGTLGIKICVAGFGPGDMDTREKVYVCAKKLKYGASLLKKHALSLMMHNHWWEFAFAYDGKTAYQILMESAPEMGSELDIYWSTRGKADTVEVLKNWKGRFAQLHVKDGDLSEQDQFCALGDGKVSLQTILQAATDPGIGSLIVEQDNSEIDVFESIDRSFKWLMNNGFGYGK